jgi:HK97 family phage portal protein
MASILTRFKAAAAAFRGKSGAQVLFPGTSGSWAGWLNGPRTKIDYPIEVGRPGDNSAVQSCLGWIADAWPEAIPYMAKSMRGGKEDKQYQHALISLFERPNAYYSGQLLRDGLLQDLLIEGTAFARIVRDRYGIPVELYWLPTDSVRPFWEGPDEWIRYWEYTPQGQLQKIDPADMLIWKQGINPTNGGRTGYSRLKSALRDIYRDNEAANTTNAILKNRAQMGIMASPDGRYFAELVKGGINPFEAGYSKEVAQELETRINAKNTGDNRGSTNVFSVPMSITEFGSVLKEVSSPELHNLSEERICAIFKIPPVVIGLGTGLEASSDKHNMETAQRQAWLNCIVPLQNQFARIMTEEMVPQFEVGQWRFGFDRTNVDALQENTSERADRVVKLWQGDVLKHGEARSEMGLESDPATEELYYSEFTGTGEQPEEQGQGDLTDEAKQFKAQMVARWRGGV